jgi:hypothetical protein
MKKLLDLKLFGLVAFLAFALVFIGVDFIEGQVKVQAKPDKPGKPDKPSTSKTEWIAFEGDLVGSQAVEGCCPNDGPFPEYGMILGFEVEGFPPDTYYDGQLFINRYGAGRNQKYKVQFWNDETGIAIEIIGGVIDDDKKNKVLTVTFTDEMCVNLWTGSPIAVVTFTLVRSPY